MKVERIKRVGDLVVYRRNRGHETNIPLYFVLRGTDNRILEDFRRKAAAVRWVRDPANQTGSLN